VQDEPENQRTREPRYNYRNLDLWQQAQQLAQDIVQLVDQLPAGRSVDQLARQLTRSATSIAANIAEGHGRFGVPSYRNHLSIAKGSACETDSWLDLLRRLNLINTEQEGVLHGRCLTLIAALTRRMQDLERKLPKAVREEITTYGADDSSSREADWDAGSLVQGFTGSPP
jgi:four helix bundle protein